MNGLIDIHCHMVPGVDDGARNFKTVRQMLIAQRKQGVSRIIVTPHMRIGMFETPQEVINRRFFKMQLLVQKMQIRMKLYLGCEYHSSSSMIRDLKEGTRPTMAGSRYVLTEFSAAHTYEHIRARVYELIVKGYIPILAHIERYPALMDHFDLVEELKEMGALMQISSSAVLGEAGWKSKKLCKQLIKDDFVDFIASDAHDMDQRRPNLGECAEYLEKKAGTDYVKRVMKRNPYRILGGR